LPSAKLDIDVNAVILNDNEINAKTPVFVRHLLTRVHDAALEQFCVTCGNAQCAQKDRAAFSRYRCWRPRHIDSVFSLPHSTGV